MDKGNNEITVNRTFKSRIFAMLYRDKKELLDLYNAVTGKHYENPEEQEINTLENAIYMSMQNDVSFLIDSRLSLYEHQSIYNPNLPLRFLFYVSDIYSALTKEAHLDGTPKLELEAVMLNINPGHNKELLSTCKSLHDYSEYPARVRRYSKEMEIEDAWEDGIEETSTLIAKLAENGDLVQLEELGKTPDGLKALLKKYNISR